MPLSVQQELLLAAILGLLATTDLKAQVSAMMYGTDASDHGVGIVSCEVGVEVAQELFRRADVRGFHTRLLSSVGATLHERTPGRRAGVPA